MKNTIIYLTLIIISSAVLIYSCSKSGNSNTTTPPPAGSTTVSIQGFAFSPDTVKIKAGGSVTWTNKDSAPHTATDLNGVFNSGNLATNATYMFTFPTVGTFTYHCLIHSMMKTGVVIVSN